MPAVRLRYDRQNIAVRITIVREHVHRLRSPLGRREHVADRNRCAVHHRHRHARRVGAAPLVGDLVRTSPGRRSQEPARTCTRLQGCSRRFRAPRSSTPLTERGSPSGSESFPRTLTVPGVLRFVDRTLSTATGDELPAAGMRMSDSTAVSPPALRRNETRTSMNRPVRPDAPRSRLARTAARRGPPPRPRPAPRPSRPSPRGTLPCGSPFQLTRPHALRRRRTVLDDRPPARRRSAAR